MPVSTNSSTSTTVMRPAVAASELKFRAVLRNTRLPDLSAFQALTKATSAMSERSITYSSPSNSRISLPSATWVPTPVLVKNAGIPAPPARSFSASVPCGVSSTSNSPDKNCRSNSLFSPTYEAIIFLIWRVSSSRPKPKPSTPALLLMQVSCSAPLSRKAAIKASGIPHRPKPPTAMVCPLATTPSKAAAALG